jgi:hypothetical protein
MLSNQRDKKGLSNEEKLVHYSVEDAHVRIQKAEIFVNAIENLIKKELSKEIDKTLPLSRDEA